MSSMKNRSKRPWYRVVTAIAPPFVMYNSSSNTFYGYCIDLLKDLQSLLPFDYEITGSSEQQLNYMDPTTANSNGMIYDLMNNRSDLAVAPLWLSSDRKRVVDFTVPFYRQTGFTIMMLKRTRSIWWLRFLRVFEVAVWLGLALAFLSSTCLLWSLERYSPFSYKNNGGYRERDRFSSLKECFWLSGTVWGPASQGSSASGSGSGSGSGSATWPRNLSSRVATASWWLFAFIMIAAYSGNLAAYETLGRLERHVRSLDDLRRQYRIEYSSLENSSFTRHLNVMKDLEETLHREWSRMSVNEEMSELERARYTVWEYPFENKYSKMYDSMKERGFLTSLEQAVDMVRGVNRSREFAYIGESIPIRYIILQNCDLTQVGQEFSKRPLVFAVQKGSPLKKQLDQAITSLFIRGRMDDLEKKWWYENPLKADCPPDKEFNAGFGLHELAVLFLLIFAGIFASGTILCTQYLTHYYHYLPRRLRVHHHHQEP